MSVRRLAIMRHAKSSWDDANQSDHQRPLSPRGRRSSLELGSAIAKLAWHPNVVLCSTARRTRETWQLMTAELAVPEQVEFLDPLYLPTVDDLTAQLQRLPDSVITVLLISHNPGCEHLAQLLLGHPLTFKTADVALLVTQAPTWRTAVGAGALWTLERHLSAREFTSEKEV